jgi:5'-nucleotidase
MNIPTSALEGTPEVRTVPMDVTLYGENYEKRTDPFGRLYYWATGYPSPVLVGAETDLTALKQGCVTLTPLDYNMTKAAVLQQMRSWTLEAADATADDPVAAVLGPVFRTRPKR